MKGCEVLNGGRYAIRTFESNNAEDLAEVRRMLENDESPMTHSMLGTILFNSDDMKLRKEAIPHLKIAAEAGDAGAIWELGDAYYNGIGVRRNIPRAIDCYLESALGGCTEAMFSIAIEYLKGTNIRADYAKAFEFMSVAAENGSDNAMNGLGLMYLGGFHVDRDLKMARRWLRRSAGNGNESARSNIRMLKEYGDDYDYRPILLAGLMCDGTHRERKPGPCRAPPSR